MVGKDVSQDTSSVKGKALKTIDLTIKAPKQAGGEKKKSTERNDAKNVQTQNVNYNTTKLTKKGANCCKRYDKPNSLLIRTNHYLGWPINTSQWP